MRQFSPQAALFRMSIDTRNVMEWNFVLSFL